METLPLSAARDKFSELIDNVTATHEQYTITRNGVPVAVLVSADDWESAEETIFWLSQPGIHEDLAEAHADIASGNTISAAEMRVELGLPPKSS